MNKRIDEIHTKLIELSNEIWNGGRCNQEEQRISEKISDLANDVVSKSNQPVKSKGLDRSVIENARRFNERNEKT